MEKDSGRKPKRGLFSSIRQSLRAQIGLIVLLSYLIPVVLLGVFSAVILILIGLKILLEHLGILTF